MSTVTPDTLRADLEKAFRKKHITVAPEAAADLSLGVVLPHMKKMAAEIDRLRGIEAEADRLRNLIAVHLLTPACSCGTKSGSDEKAPGP